jgi:hypothetical protein
MMHRIGITDRLPACLGTQTGVGCIVVCFTTLLNDVDDGTQKCLFYGGRFFSAALNYAWWLLAAEPRRQQQNERRKNVRGIFLVGGRFEFERFSVLGDPARAKRTETRKSSGSLQALDSPVHNITVLLRDR